MTPSQVIEAWQQWEGEYGPPEFAFVNWDTARALMRHCGMDDVLTLPSRHGFPSFEKYPTFGHDTLGIREWLIDDAMTTGEIRFADRIDTAKNKGAK